MAGSVLGVRVRFRVLGPVEAVDGGGRSLALPGDRQRALLAALLARAGEVVSADRLAELLWADDQPADPSAALHSQVARLRRALRPGGGDGLLQTRPPGYRVAVDRDEVDAGRFERLAAQASTAPPAEAVRLLDQALALWRGPAYAGLADSDLARVEAVRLEEARLAAVERRAEALLAVGRAGDAVLDLEPFVAAEQLREQPRVTLMRALYALGRQADALAGPPAPPDPDPPARAGPAGPDGRPGPGRRPGDGRSGWAADPLPAAGWWAAGRLGGDR